MSIQTPRELKKNIKGTNIIVQKDRLDGIKNENLAMLYSIDADEATELMWFHNTLRPSKNLIAPSKLFLQGIKALQPAAQFNTFDMKKSKLRRLTKQRKDILKAMEKRKQITPTAAYRTAVNPHKVPRIGGHMPEDEVRFLSRGAKQGKSKAAEGGDKDSPQYFTKWRKRKIHKIGKGL
ncbi:unnamed protein product [Phytomonas sp. Hart1]|nr:unnamed protein product [Phytomonas sp. Hart1]|eukprot:CCW66625.1 unnamed protein product [Phytomonas sp. isolate Hart1]